MAELVEFARKARSGAPMETPDSVACRVLNDPEIRVGDSVTVDG